jgi:hypothetical protein
MTNATQLARGAALVVSLVLLTIMSLLGTVGMSMATLEIAIARNVAYRRAAFEGAAAGIELALASRPSPLELTKSFSHKMRGNSAYAVEATMSFREATPLRRAGFSIGADSGAFAAYHFEIVSTGHAPRNAVAIQRQGFYIIGPYRDE